MVKGPSQLSVAVIDDPGAMGGTLSHSTVMSWGPDTTTGFCVSSRVTVTVVLKMRPQSSTASNKNSEYSLHASSAAEQARSTTMSPVVPSVYSPFNVPLQRNQPPKP